jgi:hypothetical protein
MRKLILQNGVVTNHEPGQHVEAYLISIQHILHIAFSATCERASYYAFLARLSILTGPSGH